MLRLKFYLVKILFYFVSRYGNADNELKTIK